jgi:hypothetical protein
MGCRCWSDLAPASNATLGPLGLWVNAALATADLPQIAALPVLHALRHNTALTQLSLASLEAVGASS